MPMSGRAAAGLQAAVTWNPQAARYLMQILRALPMGVLYKEQDRYGPLSLMLSAMPRVRHITKDVIIPAAPESFPQEKLKDCEIFNAEWLQRRFSKQELADAIEALLAQVEPQPLLGQVDADMFLVIRNTGTFLQTPDDTSRI